MVNHYGKKYEGVEQRLMEMQVSNSREGFIDFQKHEVINAFIPNRGKHSTISKCWDSNKCLYKLEVIEKSNLMLISLNKLL